MNSVLVSVLRTRTWARFVRISINGSCELWLRVVRVCPGHNSLFFGLAGPSGLSTCQDWFCRLRWFRVGFYWLEVVFNAFRWAMSRADRRENHQNHCFFKFFGHNLAQMVCPDLAPGLVMVISHEDSDFDSPEAQNPRKLRVLHKKSDFAFSSY